MMWWDETGTLRFRPESGRRRDKLRHYRLLVDGDGAGIIAEGQALDLRVSTGEHRLRMKLDWCNSLEQPGGPRGSSPGQVVDFVCGPGGKHGPHSHGWMA